VLVEHPRGGSAQGRAIAVGERSRSCSGGEAYFRRETQIFRIELNKPLRRTRAAVAHVLNLPLKDDDFIVIGKSPIERT
jgi:hypothetical protein